MTRTITVTPEQIHQGLVEAGEHLHAALDEKDVTNRAKLYRRAAGSAEYVRDMASMTADKLEDEVEGRDGR